MSVYIYIPEILSWSNMNPERQQQLTRTALLFLLFAAIVGGGGPTVATTTMVFASTSSSSEDEDEEEETEEEETTSADDEQVLTIEPPSPSQQPLPVPAQQQQPAQAPPTQAPQQQQSGVSVQDLIQKYGANRTLNLDASGLTLGQSQDTYAPGDRAVIMTLDDNWKSQHTFAAPIMENNGFNGTFFVYCLGVEQGPAFMTAEDVRDLHARGFDIQSHSMTHPDLVTVDSDTLDFEIAQSKPCLQDMVPGLNVTIFATPFATGEDNATVLQKIVDSGYQMARVGYGESFNIQCNGWYVPANQTAGCQLYEPGTNELKYQNRFDIPTLDVNSLGRENNHDLNATQAAFEEMLTDNIQYDPETGKVNTLPVLVYHNFTDQVLPEMGQSLLAESFAQQMQYLKDNGFVVLSMADLQYHPNNATFTIPKLDKLGYS